MATGGKSSIQESSSATAAGHVKSSNLESVTCLWLDQNVDRTDDNRQTQQELRQVINYLRTFNDTDQCEQYIQQITQEKIVLIVSGSFGRQIVPRLHSLSQFSACYVFCGDKQANEQWANKYKKVKGVFVKRSELITAIAKDQATRNKVEENTSIAVISHGSQSLQAHNAIFMWFQLFIEVLLRMHHKSSDRREILEICKKTYKGNSNEMVIIDEFEKTYKRENAIWWYTREACFYRMMNKALRVQDYDILFSLRFFITDIAKQLQDEHEKFIRTSDTRTVMHVYRGQAIGINELKLMKNSVGEFLSMNSFLSTSRNRATAMKFIRMVSTSDEYQRILFEIKIDPRLKTKGFADISQLSYYKNEDEVLIMLGALFRIQNVVEDKKNDTWIAEISLASDDDYDLKEMFAFMTEKIGDDTNLDSLGRILVEMGEYRQAEKCYKRFLEDAQSLVGDAQLGIGSALVKCEKYDKSLEFLQHALNLRRQIFGDDHVKVGQCFRRLGHLHWTQGNYDKALANDQKALKIYEKAPAVDPVELARTYTGIAVTYDNMNEWDLALKYYHKTLEVQEASLPPYHPDLSVTFNNLGCFYHDANNFTEALKYYQQSLRIKRKILPPTHEDIIRTEKNIKDMERKVKK